MGLEPTTFCMASHSIACPGSPSSTTEPLPRRRLDCGACHRAVKVGPSARASRALTGLLDCPPATRIASPRSWQGEQVANQEQPGLAGTRNAWISDPAFGINTDPLRDRGDAECGHRGRCKCAHPSTRSQRNGRSLRSPLRSRLGVHDPGESFRVALRSSGIAACRRVLRHHCDRPAGSALSLEAVVQDSGAARATHTDQTQAAQARKSVGRLPPTVRPGFSDPHMSESILWLAHRSVRNGGRRETKSGFPSLTFVGLILALSRRTGGSLRTGKLAGRIDGEELRPGTPRTWNVDVRGLVDEADTMRPPIPSRRSRRHAKVLVFRIGGWETEHIALNPLAASLKTELSLLMPPSEVDVE